MGRALRRARKTQARQRASAVARIWHAKERGPFWLTEAERLEWCLRLAMRRAEHLFYSTSKDKRKRSINPRRRFGRRSQQERRHDVGHPLLQENDDG